MNNNLEIAEIARRALKYLIEGTAVALAAYYIPQGKRLSFEEITMIAVTAAATFAILDMYTPSISNAARTGAGMGIGFNLTGFPMG
jgi:hypothetical protein